MHNVAKTLLGNYLQNSCLLTQCVNWNAWWVHLKSFYGGASRTSKELAGLPGDHIAMALAGVEACPVIQPIHPGHGWIQLCIVQKRRAKTKERVLALATILSLIPGSRSYFHSCFEICPFWNYQVLSSSFLIKIDDNDCQWASSDFYHHLLNWNKNKKKNVLQWISLLFCLEIQDQFSHQPWRPAVPL